MPKVFVHGSESSGLDYLGTLRDVKVETISIPDSDHFPLYTNPVVFCEVLAEILSRP